ncbi:MAG: hypothetical protein MN733_34060, partial [Nitrososphaera sp.]|nr:hypothetical protein [Nitrososphaera sp.]
LSEVSVSMNFFMREYPSTNIPLTVLFGNEERVRQWGDRLSRHLSCRVEMGQAWLASHVESGVPLSFASAVGLLQAGKAPKNAIIDFVKRRPISEGITSKAVSMQAPSPTSIKAWLASLKPVQVVMNFCLAAALIGGTWFVSNLKVTSERSRLAHITQSNPELGWGLSTLSKEELETLKAAATAQLALLKRILEKPISIAEKLDAVARTLPEGVWLTDLAFEYPLGEKGISQLRMVANGACFLGAPDRELGAIQQVEEALKGNSLFLKGFGSAHVDKIDVRKNTPGSSQQYTYRTFQLNCKPEETL